MEFVRVVETVASILKQFDSERPIHKAFQPGIGPFGEPQLVKVIAERLSNAGIPACTRRSPDLAISNEWAIEFKLVRPYGDNGAEAENWSVNMLHPYSGNVSLIGDALKLQRLLSFTRMGLLVIGYEHNPARISLDPLIESFEQIAVRVMHLPLGERFEAKKTGLVHPEHQVLRCIGWELLASTLSR